MVDLSFTVERVEAEKYSAAPVLLFYLRIANAGLEPRIENVLLNCQIRLEPTQRAYSVSERERLVELFGASERFAETLRSQLWTHASIAVPPFERDAVVALPAPCTHDFNVASAKYFYGLIDGEAPLSFLFSGSVFFRDEEGALQIAQIPWSKEARFRLPVSVWRELMQLHYRGSALLRVGSETLERLFAFKRRRGFLSFDDALDRLLEDVEADAS